MEKESSIYGKYEPALYAVRDMLVKKIGDFSDAKQAQTGEGIYDHILSRVKSDESMREKCRSRGLSEDARTALRDITDSIGLRIVCSFVDDIFENVEFLRSLDCIEIVREKDYVRQAKPNGYRSYHMICMIEAPFEDPDGNCPGKFYAEIQLRTIAMDTWASLEHKMKYKRSVHDQALITAELKRVADELASCDISLQTIRAMINADI